jgi:hypothetical protein
MLRRVALVRTDILEEFSASFIRSPILVTLMKEALRFSETSVLTRATRRNIPEDTILHSYSRENRNSYRLTYDFRSHFKIIGLELDRIQLILNSRPDYQISVYLSSLMLKLSGVQSQAVDTAAPVLRRASA